MVKHIFTNSPDALAKLVPTGIELSHCHSSCYSSKTSERNLAIDPSTIYKLIKHRYTLEVHRPLDALKHCS